MGSFRMLINLINILRRLLEDGATAMTLAAKVDTGCHYTMSDMTNGFDGYYEN